MIIVQQTNYDLHKHTSPQTTLAHQQVKDISYATETLLRFSSFLENRYFVVYLLQSCKKIWGSPCEFLRYWDFPEVMTSLKTAFSANIVLFLNGGAFRKYTSYRYNFDMCIYHSIYVSYIQHTTEKQICHSGF